MSSLTLLMERISSDRGSHSHISVEQQSWVKQPDLQSNKSQFVVQGHVVLTSPGYSHRLGSVFQEPLKYDPERFRVGAEDKKASSFTACAISVTGCCRAFSS